MIVSGLPTFFVNTILYLGNSIDAAVHVKRSVVIFFIWDHHLQTQSDEE
jgi:hypothetical protein